MNADERRQTQTGALSINAQISAADEAPVCVRLRVSALVVVKQHVIYTTPDAVVHQLPEVVLAFEQ